MRVVWHHLISGFLTTFATCVFSRLKIGKYIHEHFNMGKEF